MKLKSLVTMLLIVFAVGALFTGCSKGDDSNSQIGEGDSVDTGNQDNAPADESADETVDDILSEDTVEEDVEIGSLI